MREKVLFAIESSGYAEKLAFLVSFGVLESRAVGREVGCILECLQKCETRCPAWIGRSELT